MGRNELARLISQLTRRRFLSTAVAAGLMSRLPAVVGAEGTPVEGWPRTVAGSLGDVTIPSKPERILALSDWGEVDYLMAMGVRPALYGYTNRYGEGVSPWLTAAGGDSLESFAFDIAEGADLEIVASAHPDLIVAEPHFAEPVLSQLSAIAPTLGVPTTFTGATWRDAQLILGEAAGTDESAVAAVAQTDAEIAAGRATLEDLAGRTVTVLYFSDGEDGATFSIVPDSGAALLAGLGLSVNSYGSTDAFESRSMETINSLADADLLLVLDFGFGDSTFQDNPLFATLPAAQAGRYAVLDVVPTRAFWGQTTLSVRWVIPYLVAAIQAAAAGAATPTA